LIGLATDKSARASLEERLAAIGELVDGLGSLADRLQAPGERAS
jgi:hypothetical protein